MADITAEMIKELRAKTQAGMLDCKKALVDNDGDMGKATDFLRKKGLAKASKQAGREVTEGVIHSYIHSNRKIGVLLKLNCVTDFVAMNEDFIQLADDISMQIAATAPQYVSSEEVPTEVVEKEKEIYRGQMADSGKPENVIEKIIEGKINKFYSEICLLDQEFIKESKVKIKDLIKSKISALGENIEIGQFTRYNLG